MKYSPQELKRQKNGFVFNANDFFETVLPSGWDNKRLVQAKNDIVKETNLMAETTANMAAIGLKSKTDINQSVKDFVKKYGTGLANTDVSKKLPHGQNLLRNRVENTLLYENAENVERMYPGRKFIWLPSDAKEPRHTHMLRYGKVFEVGGSVLPSDDNFPGKAFGCKCGYQWVEEEATEYSTLDEDLVDIQKYVRAAKLEGTPKTMSRLFQVVADHPTEIWDILDFDSMRRSFVRSFPKESAVVDSFRTLIESNDEVKSTIRAGGEALTKEIRTVKKDTYNPKNYMQSPVNLTLFRGGEKTAQIEKLKAGSVIHINEPTYTSITREGADQFIDKKNGVVYKIHLKAGARINPTMLISNFGGAEGEMMLAPQNVFKVKSISTVKGLLMIVLESVKGTARTKGITI